MESLIALDKTIFSWLNAGLANPVFDFLMPIITDARYWMPVYVAGLLYLIIKGGVRGRVVAATLIATAIVSDQISSQVLKHLFDRPRPCHSLDELRLLIKCGSGKSFPSSHSVNNFAAATVLMYFFRKYKYVFYSIAAIIAFSRVYVGVHYPLDITAGAAIGILIGWAMVWLSDYVTNKYKIGK